MAERGHCKSDAIVGRVTASQIFQKYFAQLLKLLKLSIEMIMAHLYSEGLISEEVREKQERMKVMQALHTQVDIEPQSVWKIIACFEEELPNNSVIRKIKEELEDAAFTITAEVTPKKKSTLQRYKLFLQSQYKRHRVSMDDKLLIAPCNSFIDVNLVKRSSNISRVSTKMTFENIIEPGDEYVLVIGCAGMGKSTLALELCQRWDTLKSLMNFKIVLLLRLRESRIQGMTEVTDIFYHRDIKLSKAVVEEVMECEGEGLLLIFDGFDELPDSVIEDSNCLIAELLKGDCLPMSVRLITSRPSALHRKPQIFPKKMKEIEIEGFSTKCKEEYFDQSFGSKPNLLAHMTNHVLSNPVFQFIFVIPLNCAIVAAIYEDMYKSQISLPKTMTELYCYFSLVLIRRYMMENNMWKREKELPQKISDLPEQIVSRFNSICKLAYDGVLNFKRKEIFSSTDVDEKFCHLGLMEKYSEMYSYAGTKVKYRFLHASVQEFLAAWHAVSSPDVDVDYMKKFMYFRRISNRPPSPIFFDFAGIKMGKFNVSYEPYIPFLFGLSVIHSDRNKIWEFLCSLLKHSGRLKRTMLGSIFECQRPELCVELDYQFQCITVGCQLDMYLFGYILQNSACCWDVRAYCSFSFLKSILTSNILGSIRELDLRYRKELSYSELQCLPLNNLRRFYFVIVSSQQSLEASHLIHSLDQLECIMVKIKLSRTCCVSDEDWFFRIITNDFILYKSFESNPHLTNLSLTFCDISTSGVRNLSHLFSSSSSLKKVKLTTLNKDLTELGITSHLYDSMLISLTASQSLRELTINFGHEILANFICCSRIEKIDIYIDDEDAVYDFIAVLNGKLQVNSTINVKMYPETCNGIKLSLPCLAEALRNDGSEVYRKHKRSKSLPLYLEDCLSNVDNYEDTCSSISERDSSFSGQSSSSVFEEDSDSDLYSSNSSDSYMSPILWSREELFNEGQAWRHSCPNLLNIHEISSMHPVLHSTINTRNIFYSPKPKSCQGQGICYEWL